MGRMPLPPGRVDRIAAGIGPAHVVSGQPPDLGRQTLDGLGQRRGDLAVRDAGQDLGDSNGRGHATSSVSVGCRERAAARAIAARGIGIGGRGLAPAGAPSPLFGDRNGAGHDGCRRAPGRSAPPLPWWPATRCRSTPRRPPARDGRWPVQVAAPGRARLGPERMARRSLVSDGIEQTGLIELREPGRPSHWRSNPRHQIFGSAAEQLIRGRHGDGDILGSGPLQGARPGCPDDEVRSNTHRTGEDIRPGQRKPVR